MPAKDAFDEEDMTNDLNGHVPMNGSKDASNQKERFLDRLSRMTAANVRPSDHKREGSLDIFVTRSPGSPQSRVELDKELGQFLQHMERALSIISAHQSGPRYAEAEGDLWDAILEHAYLNVDHVIASMARVFKDNSDAFDDFMTRYFGLDAVDIKGSKKDDTLGELLVALHQSVVGYDRSMSQLNGLVLYASGIVQTIDFLHVRLGGLLLRKRFANDLYQLICTLGLPKRANDTFVEAAKGSQAFKNLNFHLLPSVIPPRRVRFAALPATTNSRSSAIPSRPVRMPHAAPTLTTHLRNPTNSRSGQDLTADIKPNVDSSDSSDCSNTTTLSCESLPLSDAIASDSSAPPKSDQKEKAVEAGAPPVPITQHSDIASVIRPYLTSADQALSVAQLSPAAKQDTAQLLGAVLRCKLLPIPFHAYYSFGFVTAQDTEQERQLAGLYSAILQEAPTPTTIFRELVQALETNTLVRLFDIKEYAHFRQLFPRLESFLRTPPEKRSSVWRLIQYIRIETYTEPPAVLKRDYGLQFCITHQEVDLLKTIYTRILAKCSPQEVHEACKHGRIVELAQQKGVHIEHDHRRFMQNDYGYPGVGFDNDEGLEKHKAPLFKRTPKA